jgi:hypothetical protein
VFNMWPCKDNSHIQVLIIYFFPTPPIKLKHGLQIGERLLIINHIDKSNYLANWKSKEQSIIWFDCVYKTFPRFLKYVNFSRVKINVFLFIFVMWHGWRSSQRNRRFNTSGDNHTESLVLMENMWRKCQNNKN